MDGINISFDLTVIKINKQFCTRTSLRVINVMTSYFFFERGRVFWDTSEKKPFFKTFDKFLDTSILTIKKKLKIIEQSIRNLK